MKEKHNPLRGQCEAPFHVKGCHYPKDDNLTADHFTPRCIAKLIGWSKRQMNKPDNIQMLSLPCHRAKDSTTPDKYYQTRSQLKGKFIGFGEHK